MADFINPTYEQIWNKEGFIVIENIFTDTEIEQLRDEILTHAENKANIISNCGGYSIVDFIQYHPSLTLCKQILDNPKIHTHLKQVFNGDNYRFIGHNDIGVNRSGGWHKDVLNNGPGYNLTKYTTPNVWSTHEGEKQQIIKLAIYLQDHHDNNQALEIVPNSNRTPSMDASGSVYTHPKKGDILIFDQRITHRGNSQGTTIPRIMISYGLGRKNIFSDNFEKGTRIRQDYQHNNFRNKGNIF